jgi:hypothetical protein
MNRYEKREDVPDNNTSLIDEESALKILDKVANLAGQIRLAAALPRPDMLKIVEASNEIVDYCFKTQLWVEGIDEDSDG